MTKNDKNKEALKRFSVTDLSSMDTLLAQVTLINSDDNKVSALVKGDDDKIIKQIEEILRGITSENSMPYQSIFDIVREAFNLEGLDIHELPNEDISFKLEYDLNNNSLIGQQKKILHQFGDLPDDLAGKIQKSIAKTLSSFGLKLTEKLNKALEGDHIQDAVAAIKEAHENGSIQIFPSEELLNALLKIPTDDLPKEDALIVLKSRLGIASILNRHLEAAEDSELLLAQHGDSLEPELRNELKMAIGIGAQARGCAETALAIWCELLTPPENLKAGSRGWAWRNIALALGPKDSETKDAARYSVDAFLEAGDKRDAAGSFAVLIESLVHEQPAKAIPEFTELLELIDANSLHDRALLANIYHERAQHHRKTGNHNAAFSDAAEAAGLWRELVGCEDYLIASLNLAAIEAKQLGQLDEWKKLHQEAFELAKRQGDFRNRFGERVAALFKNYNYDEAQTIAREAQNSGDIELLAGVRTIQATADNTLTLPERLKILEATLQNLNDQKSGSKVKEPIQMGIATVLMNGQKFRRAIIWLRKILADDPLNHWARESLIQCLWKDENWGEAAIFLDNQINQFGELPGLLLAYGKSLSEAGDFSSSIHPLTRAMELIDEQSDQHKEAREIREHALQLMDKPVPLSHIAIQSSAPLTRDELENSLHDFSNFISADKRMIFWTKPKGANDYKWVSKPEQVAQNLLHTFLKARFGQRVIVFEELNVGAGRLDIFIQLFGGLSVVLELKMCGFRYSAPYAAAGEEQIFHYLENKATHLGFLVVFDSRLEDNENSLLKHPNRDSYAVSEVFVDVRPRVTTKTRITPLKK